MLRPTTRTPLTAGLAVVTLAGLAIPCPAEAVPVFARKYGTSCQTCHVAFPKLTPFGDAFRRNGYRWPAGEEEDTTKDEPVALGHDAHKRVFPDSVWPGEIPGWLPLSFQGGSSVRIAPSRDAQVDFASVGGNLGLNVAATLGDVFSVWMGAAFRGTSSGGAEAEIERVFAIVQLFEGPALNFRVGRFEAGASAVTVHRTLGIAPWFLTTPVRDNPFTLDPVQFGIEANGVLAGRLDYAVGVVEGAGALNTPKDVYARLAYKIGGMQPDGVGGAAETEPWRDTSFALGAFGYYGHPTIGDAAVADQDDTFILIGGDASLIVHDLNLIAAFTYSRNERPSLATPTESVLSWHAFAQIDYVLFPWLVPTVRYEHRDIGGESGDRISGGIYALIRANVRAQVLAAAADTGTGFELDQIQIGLNLAF